MIGKGYSLFNDLFIVMSNHTNACECCDSCEKHNKFCTVIIALLVSLCLILFTALSISLIVLRRRNAFAKEDSDNENSRVTANEANDHDESFITPRKPSSYEGISIRSQNGSVSGRDGIRKSSLKSSKLDIGDHNLNIHKKATFKTSYDNAAYSGGEMIETLEEELAESEISQANSERRKSVVTFSDVTEYKIHV